MNPTPQEPDNTSQRPHPRRRRRWAFEQLEDRTLLATGPGAGLRTATQLHAPSDVANGLIAPGAPVYFRIDPAADALLIARVHSVGPLTRLSLLDSQGHLLVQSEGQSATNKDNLIDQHVVSGTDYLELQSLGGAGSYTLSTDLTDSSQPYQPAPAGSAPPIVFGDLSGDGILDFA